MLNVTVPSSPGTRRFMKINCLWNVLSTPHTNMRGLSGFGPFNNYSTPSTSSPIPHILPSYFFPVTFEFTLRSLPSLHPLMADQEGTFSFGTRLGLAFTVQSACCSALMVSGLLSYILVSVVRCLTNPYSPNYSSTPL